MKQSISLEQTLLEKLRLLPIEKQKEVLDFVQFLAYKAQQAKQLPNASSESSISRSEPPIELSLLDGEDYLIDAAITRSHDAFLQGCAPEDEGLYDHY